jgi:DNA repair ATPase RecN
MGSYFGLESVERVTSAGTSEVVQFKPGLNLLVGRPNTGKTVWLRMLNYALGDRDSAEDALSEELAAKYDLLRVRARVGQDEVTIERRWKESGAKHKVFLDGIAVDSGGLSQILLEKLAIPVLHYPQGNPYSSRAWPDLSWRSLYRHIYRRQTSWGSLIEKQPESEVHACILQFLGLAGDVFSAEYASLVEAQKSRVSLEAQRETFMRMLNQISQELVDVESEVVGVTPDVISNSVQRINGELNRIAEEREALLSALREKSADRAQGRVQDLGEERGRLLSEHENSSQELAAAEARIRDVLDYGEDLEAEINRLERARVSGAVFSGLRITHCPACDRAINGSSEMDSECFLCRRALPAHRGNDSGEKRLSLAIRQLQTERDEASRLVAELKERRRDLSRTTRKISERIGVLEADLGRVRTAAAAILPPELAQHDLQAGRLEERRRQWERIGEALKRRKQITTEVEALQTRVDRLEKLVEHQATSVDFETAADWLCDGMNDYLTGLNEARRGAWTQDEVSLRLDDKKFVFRVGDERWDRRLGGTLTLYFLLSYQYGLLRLSRRDGCNYPGLTVLDMPAELPDVESVADLENFVLMPFLRLLSEPDMEGAQVIVAGSAFMGLPDVHRIELDEVYK